MVSTQTKHVENKLTHVCDGGVWTETTDYSAQSTQSLLGQGSPNRT